MLKVVHNVQFTMTNVQSVLLIGQSVVEFTEVFRSMTNCRICRRIVMEHWPNANEKRCNRRNWVSVRHWAYLQHCAYRMAYLQNNSAFLPNGSSMCLPHSNQCDEINCSLAKQFEDAESYAQCPIYYDHCRTGVQSVLHNGLSLMRFIELLFNDELPKVPPNCYGTLSKRKREKV